MNLLDLYIQYIEDALEIGAVETARNYLFLLDEYDLQPYQRVLIHDLANQIQHHMFKDLSYAHSN